MLSRILCHVNNNNNNNNNNNRYLSLRGRDRRLEKPLLKCSDLYTSRHVVEGIKSWNMKWMGYVAGTGEREIHLEFQGEYLKKINCLEGLCFDGTTCTGFTWLRTGTSDSAL
jgi:hypothetical protein